ncbi:oligosaccharide repeat unit polymerase [Elizabethkingia anophelis]|nr:oligosaccharide repeat unit polymerase [Elizabethkingia anophelis]
MKKIHKNYKPAYFILLIFVFCCIGSFFYALITDRFNGDFLGVKVSLSTVELVFNLLLSILPYILLWKMYKKSKRTQEKKQVLIPFKFFRVFLVVLIFWNMLVTKLYGVGVLAAPPYEAPSSIKIIIQIINRFNPTYGVFIYLFVCNKKDRFQFVLIALLLILAYMRAGIGIFLYLFMIYFVKHYNYVIAFIKKRFIILIGIIIIFPFLVNKLYELRSTLRGQTNDEVVLNILSGVLMGRMSSFSDSAFILQEANYFENKANNLDPLYFQLQCLGGVFSMDFMPENRPEKMLFQFYYSDLEDNVAYMAGTNGNLYMSFMKSPFVFLLNLISIIVLISLTFKCFRKINFKYNNELAFILLIYVVTSGVANEYAFLLFSIFVYLLLFYFVNTFNKAR